MKSHRILGDRPKPTFHPMKSHEIVWVPKSFQETANILQLIIQESTNRHLALPRCFFFLALPCVAVVGLDVFLFFQMAIASYSLLDIIRTEVYDCTYPPP